MDATPDFPRVHKPFLARVLSPPGPPDVRLVQHEGSCVLAVPGRYCVSYLLVENGSVVVVDCGSTADLSLVVQGLRALGLTRHDVLGVAPSHLHFDHILGIDALAGHFGAPVLLGEVARRHVEEGASLSWPRRWRLLRALPTWPMQGLPLSTPRDWSLRSRFGFPWTSNQFEAPLGTTLRHGEPLPGMPSWRVLATPGHADDALCFHHEEAGWLVCGDTLRNFLGGEWNPLLSDPEAYRETRSQLAEARVTVVFPGHGPSFEPEGESLASIPRHPAYYP